MPGLARKKVLAAAIEDTPGAAEALDAGDAVFLVYDPRCEPQVGYNERAPVSGSMHRIKGQTDGEVAQMTFAVDMLPSENDAGVDIDAPAAQYTDVQPGPRNDVDAENIPLEFHDSVMGESGKDALYFTFEGLDAIPDWASTFLPACGWVASGRVYYPLTEPPGTNVKTLTIGLYEDGRYKQIAGASGTFTITLSRGQPVQIEFTFTGIFSDPSDVAILTPTFPTINPMRFKGTTVSLTVDSVEYNPKVSEISLDAGNTMTMLPDANQSSGYQYAMVTDRNPTGNIDPESELVATNAPYAALYDHTEYALHIELQGSGE